VRDEEIFSEGSRRICSGRGEPHSQELLRLLKDALQGERRTKGGMNAPHTDFDDGGKQGITSQIGMIVEILIAQSQSDQSLADQFLDTVFDQIGISPISVAPRQQAADPQSGIHLTQKESTSVTAERSPGKIGLHSAKKIVAHEDFLTARKVSR